MTSTRTNKPVMAEMLVRQVFGEAESFERVCAQRGVSVEAAVKLALQGWVGQGLALVSTMQLPLPGAEVGLSPDPGDCPTGQESHWVEVCEHDLQVLRAEQQRCYRTKDRPGIERTTRRIESYLQALAELRDRVA